MGVESYLSLGSNVGDRRGFLRKALEMISDLRDVKLSGVSGVYETEPVGFKRQAPFLNLAVRIFTAAGPNELIRELKEIESKLGRIRRERWREREIDIDIIFYGDAKIDSDELVIPHPSAHLRRFVLQPLSELAPDFIHPSLHETVSELLRKCTDSSWVTRLEQLSPAIG